MWFYNRLQFVLLNFTLKKKCSIDWMLFYYFIFLATNTMNTSSKIPIFYYLWMEGILPGQDIYKQILWTGDQWEEAVVGRNLSSRHAGSLKACLQKLTHQHCPVGRSKSQKYRKALLPTAKLHDVTWFRCVGLCVCVCALCVCMCVEGWKGMM